MATDGPIAPSSTTWQADLHVPMLDLLITTPISSLAIVLGKLLSALSWILLLLLASIPVTALVFTFGGVGITENGEVNDTSGNVIGGLFAAGEITGGSFFNNYPGGSGLMKGAVFGRLAGTSAAVFAKAKRASAGC